MLSSEAAAIKAFDFKAYVKAAPIGFAAFILLAFVVMHGLGIWQLQRLQWKQGLMAEMARTQALPPVPLSQVGDKPDWRAVTLPSCDVDPAQAVFMHMDSEGRMGARVLIPCPTGEGADILVDLGFVPERTLPAAFSFTPVGRLRPLEAKGDFVPENTPDRGEWYWRSIADLAAFWQTPLRDDYFMVASLDQSQPDWTGLEQAPMGAPLTNRHLEYAMTWFLMAWTLMGLFLVYVHQRTKKAAA